jgi:hypothetical protein
VGVGLIGQALPCSDYSQREADNIPESLFNILLNPCLIRRNYLMKTPIRTAVCLALLSMASLPTAAFAQAAPAPGPIIGAGLPVLAVGYGVYWLIRRRSAK